MRRALFLIALTSAELVSVARAEAQTPQSQWAAADFLIRVLKKDGEKFVYIPENEAKLEFFNNARCLCETPVQISVDLSNTGVAKRSLIAEGNVRMMVGSEACASDSLNEREAAGCVQLGERKLGDLGSNGWVQETTVNKLFDARKGGTGCGQQFEQKIWLLLTTNNRTTLDLTGDAAPSLVLSLDGEPPPAPEEVKVTAGNEALGVSWKRQSGVSSFNGYVVFCARGGTLPVFDPSPYESRQYSSAATVCPERMATSSPLVAFADAGGSTGTAVAPPDAFRTLDPAFVCSGLLTSAGDTRIAILENKIPYVVGVTAIDTHGNASPIETALLQTPIPTRDFYQGYRQAGGAAEGGFCAYGNGRPGLLALAGVAFALVLAFRRRRS
jgi:hypothetical protein